MGGAGRGRVVRFARRASGLAWLLASLLVCTLARGDAASGTYTGSVAVRGNYYWEESTRVVAPSIGASVASPSGVRVEGMYLLDAITSASQATGVQDDIAFTERRNEGHAGLGYELDLGDQQLDLSARGRYSKEPDYVSRGIGFAAALSLDQRNTVLHLTGYYLLDDVYRRVRGAPATSPDRSVVRSAEHVGDLDALSLGAAWDQVLSPSATFTLGYDLALLDGFQANPYRNVPFANGGGAPEKHPDARTRHAGYLWLAYYYRETRLALRAGYRLYYDSWEILAHAPEVRIHQEIGRHLELRLRYRYYTQSAAYFWRRGGNLREDAYYTHDPKMGEFYDHTYGLKVRLALDFLAFTALDFLRTAVLDWNVEYLRRPRKEIYRYGPVGFIAQGGIAWSF